MLCLGVLDSEMRVRITLCCEGEFALGRMSCSVLYYVTLEEKKNEECIIYVMLKVV